MNLRNVGTGTGIGIAILFGLICAGAHGQDAQGSPARRGAPNKNEDPTLEAARVKYSADQWTRGERRDGFALGDLTLTGLTGGETEFRGDLVVRTFADAAGTPRVLIEMTLGDRIGAAHAALLRHVAYVQSTKTLETLAQRGIRAGDVGYIAYGGQDGSKVAWIAFVVGNLEFRVVNLDADAPGAADLVPLVERISATAMAQPVLGAGEVMHRPTVTSFAADRTTVPPGESVLLDVAASDGNNGAPRLDFAVAPIRQGGGYVEQDDQGRWRFYATAAGRVTISVRVLGKNGTTAEKTLDLTIAKS
jgi:hypothetical protein